MHPYFMQALARERTADMLRAQHVRESGADGVVGYVAPVDRPLRHLRRSVGSVLVVAGTRLMAPRPPDLAHQTSPPRSLR